MSDILLSRSRSRMGAVACVGALWCAPALAGGPPPDYAPMVARYARQHGVPERLIHRVIMRESRYNPRVVARGNYGLMQIKLGTARGMGYSGGAQGLLDPDVNMRHAVAYLANAYITARGNEDLAVRYYAGGYYYAAKRLGLLGRMRTAHSGAPDEATETPPVQEETPRRAAYAPTATSSDAAAAIAAGAKHADDVEAAPAKSRKSALREAGQRRAARAQDRPTPPERPAEAAAPQVDMTEAASIEGPDPARN